MPKEHGLESLRVMVVDDSATARHYFCGLLRELGYEAQAAASGAEALEMLHGRAYDLVLCDLVMPDMDGLKLLKAMRDQGLALPFLLITSHASLATAVEAVQAGADDYIMRPVDAGLLAHRLEAVLRRSAVDQERRQRQSLEAALATAGGVAHEMNQPLMAIMASAELMQMTGDGQRHQELAEVIVTQAERLGRITRRLLNLTRYQTKAYLGDTVILDLEASSRPSEDE